MKDCCCALYFSMLLCILSSEPTTLSQLDGKMVSHMPQTDQVYVKFVKLAMAEVLSSASLSFHKPLHNYSTNFSCNRVTDNVPTNL